jgi:glutamine---fructose-6-phosphate transaminase (isomerizing)
VAARRRSPMTDPTSGAASPDASVPGPSAADVRDPGQPARFLGDLEAKPSALARLADAIARPGFLADVPARPRRVAFLGIGSSRFAAEVAALRLRARGIDAVSELASATLGTRPGPDVLAVAVSATGESRETADALSRHAGVSATLAVTNAPGSTIARLAGRVVPLEAGTETGGVACRTFQHTGLVLAALEARWTGERRDLAALCARVAAATADLLERRDAWLPACIELLAGPQGTWVLAPAERLSSALQSALMVREGPRRPAQGCETGEWAHVDVYLTRTLDYRALLLAGSRWDEEALGWLARRGSTVVRVGAGPDGARHVVRYAGDEDAAVALHAETLVAELVAAAWWRSGEGLR